MIAVDAAVRTCREMETTIMNNRGHDSKSMDRIETRDRIVKVWWEC